MPPPAGTIPRCETGRSAPTGYCDAPPEFVLVPNRMIVPPAQRSPSPNALLICVVPWKYSAELLGMPLPFSTTVSAETLGLPLALKFAPPELTEFAQPFPAEPELPHG